METSRQLVSVSILRFTYQEIFFIEAHINNLYNTTFWALVQQAGETTTQAHAILKVSSRVFAIRHTLTRKPHPQGTISKQKHEILFSQFGINYNNLDGRYKKGSVLVREAVRWFSICH